MPFSNTQEAMLTQALADIRSATTNMTRDEAYSLLAAGKIPVEFFNYIAKVKKGDWPPLPTFPTAPEPEAKPAAKPKRTRKTAAEGEQDAARDE